MSVSGLSLQPSLLFRFLSAVIFIPILLIVNTLGGLPYVAFVLAIILVSLFEFYQMGEAKGLEVPKIIGILSGLFLCLAFSRQNQTILPGSEWWIGASMLCMMLGLVFLLGGGKIPNIYLNISTLLAGICYIVLPLGCFLLLRGMGDEPWKSRSYALLPYFLTWFCDTFAYVIGLALGHHKLASTISPNKTVEGAVGGIIGAVTGGILSKVISAPYLTWWDAVALGVLVGIFGQIGDLVESAMKRNAGIKDSSKIIPGHGGALDRFDSFIFTVPLIYFYLRLFVV